MICVPIVPAFGNNSYLKIKTKYYYSRLKLNTICVILYQTLLNMI